MTFSISAKIQDISRKSEMSNFLRGASGAVLSTLWVQNLPKIALTLMVFEINDIFLFLPKFQLVAENQKSLNFSEMLEE